MMLTADSIATLGWRHLQHLDLPGRLSDQVGVDDLRLHQAARRFIRQKYDGRVYRHQHEALTQALSGRDVCLTTSTASGKSLVFQVAALDRLECDPQARVIALYPQKALGSEQEERWEQALKVAGRFAEVGRIDGSVIGHKARQRILQQCRIVVFTPDVVHAWLLSNLHDKAVAAFMRHVSLVIVDEVHTYSGVFGSNAAFLYRRLSHAFDLAGAKPSYIAASATIAAPEQHLQSLFGRSFTVIGQERDTSPRYPLQLHFVEPPQAKDFVSEVVRLLGHVAESKALRFIAFADSRKQVEQLAAILSRRRKDEGEDGASKDEPADDAPPEDDLPASDDRLARLSVLPYRAGYEENDRKVIQERLNRGQLRGVISTSALELGIDVEGLNVCILIGVPKSATSLWQRMGRVGRHGPGIVVIVNSGDIYDAAVFANPASLLERPPIESTLYLDNETIRYMHALCLARAEGEHDQLERALGRPGGEFATSVPWPEGFVDLCQAERVGQIPGRLQHIKEEGDESPNHNFPLRDIEPQFRVKMLERRNDPTSGHSLGSLSQGQLMREAYPGAVYYYAAQPYRVVRVDVRAREVFVRRERHYTTKPLRLPTQVFPNTQPGSLLQAQRSVGLTAFECRLMTRESVSGFQERRGPNQFDQAYPLPRDAGLHFNQPYFTRNLFTTGVILSHPALETPDVKLGAVAELLFEAFLIVHPFERQDVAFAVDRFEITAEHLARKGRPFLAIYDQTYGSLRLSSRLLRPGLLAPVLDVAVDLAEAQSSPDVVAVLRAIQADAHQEPQPLTQPSDERQRVTAGRTRVILEGSHGIWVKNQEEAKVERVLFTPNGVEYEVSPESYNEPRSSGGIDVPRYLAGTLGEAVQHVPAAPEPRQATPTTVFVSVDSLREIPGISQMGWFEPDTGRMAPEGDAPETPSAAPTVAPTPLTSIEAELEPVREPVEPVAVAAPAISVEPELPAMASQASAPTAVMDQIEPVAPTAVSVPPAASAAPTRTRDWGVVRRQMHSVLHDQFAPVELRHMMALLRAEGVALPPGATVDTLLAMASDGPDLERLMRIARTVFHERTRGR